jgi:hypothetical protein
MEKVITSIFIGLILSTFVLIGNDRGIIIDDIVSDIGGDTTAWQLAYFFYLLSLTTGIIFEMISHKRGRWNFRKEVYENFMIIIVFLLSLWFLDEISIGVIQSEAQSMYAEFQQWYFYYTGVIALYMINKFVRKQ